MADVVLEWAAALAGAVDTDNATPGLACAEASTLRMLQAAPEPLAGHASLAVADFVSAGHQPLARLRSDAVANHLTLRQSHPNLVVGRMTVPGGPWPGRFRLEAVVFDAEAASMPTGFPTLPRPQNGGLRLHFGRLVAASQGFRDGAGTTLFPEQLVVHQRQDRQAFGVVFLGKLAALFRDQVLPVLEQDPTTLAAGPAAPAGYAATWDLAELRRLAFLAHEWGHLAGPAPAQAVRRLVAVASELHADLAALTMLLDCPQPWAEPAAQVLVADRIVREAWLQRPAAQVDAIAARQLLALLAAAGAAQLGPRGGLRLDLAKATHAVRQELAQVRAVEQACYASDVGPRAAGAYLHAHGWTVVDGACHLELEDPLARFLSYAATGPGRAMLTSIRRAREHRDGFPAAGLAASA